MQQLQRGVGDRHATLGSRRRDVERERGTVAEQVELRFTVRLAVSLALPALKPRRQAVGRRGLPPEV